MKYDGVVEAERISLLENIRDLETYDPVSNKDWVYWEEKRQEAINDMPENVQTLLSESSYKQAVNELLE